MTLRETLKYTPVELSFGTSGLRGLIADMTDLECYINTAGFLRFLEQVEGLKKGTKIYIAGDLRSSTPRILRAVHKAITDGGYKTVNCGFIPTPALAYYAQLDESPCVMVTGSHIPDDRNGIKFYKSDGEVLKEDELAIKEAVSSVRSELYMMDSKEASFTPDGMRVLSSNLPPEDADAERKYKERFTSVFDGSTFAGKKVVVYQHSSVARDLMSEIFTALGADVVSVGRSEKFVPIDTENVTPDDRAYFRILAKENPDAFAIVSADGDADRPFLIDEHGVFHRGDVLGAVVADWLNVDFAAMPISSSDAVDKHLTEQGVQWQHTKIGSPYVIVVMNEAMRAGHSRVVGWEVNGGFLIGNDLKVNGKTMKALATRDAILPIIGAMCAAVKAKQSISELFNALPQRFTQAGLIDNFPMESYRAISDHFSTGAPDVLKELANYFTPEKGFGNVSSINNLDGVRIFFDNGDIAHLRQSNNAPQLRIYSVANSQDRADEIVTMAIAEPDGIFRSLQKNLTQ